MAALFDLQYFFVTAQAYDFKNIQFLFVFKLIYFCTNQSIEVGQSALFLPTLCFLR